MGLTAMRRRQDQKKKPDVLSEDQKKRAAKAKAKGGKSLPKGKEQLAPTPPNEGVKGKDGADGKVKA